MSFNLYILVNKTDEIIHNKWIEKLKEKGINCKFPDGFVINEDFVGEITVTCQFLPPLVIQKTKDIECEFYFEPIPIDEDFKQDAIASTTQEDLKQKLAKMKHELSIHCSADTEDNSLLLECFAAATLADVSDGVLFDPQEFGAVDGEKIYHVARYHSDVDYQNAHIASSKHNNNKSEVTPKTDKNTKSKGMSSTLIVLLLLLFMAIRHIITN